MDAMVVGVGETGIAGTARADRKVGDGKDVDKMMLRGAASHRLSQQHCIALGARATDEDKDIAHNKMR